MASSVVRFVLAVEFSLEFCCMALRSHNHVGKTTTTTTSHMWNDYLPEELVDITPLFNDSLGAQAGRKAVSVGEVTYYCCCQLDSNRSDVTCELVDVTTRSENALKKGCGGMKGAGFHSWYNIQSNRKYKGFEHAGKCAVPRKMLATTTVMDPEWLVDLTEKLDADQNTLNARGANYSCCCQKNSNKTDVTCELVDITSVPVSSFKKGCGGMKGAGFHSWNTISKLSKYNHFEHAGKCVVPWKMLDSMSSRVEKTTVQPTTTTMNSTTTTTSTTTTVNSTTTTTTSTTSNSSEASA
jgi:hypothetical protein